VILLRGLLSIYQKTMQEIKNHIEKEEKKRQALLADFEFVKKKKCMKSAFIRKIHEEKSY
jgi:hypothetical protein